MVYVDFETHPTLTHYNTKLGVGKSQGGTNADGAAAQARSKRRRILANFLADVGSTCLPDVTVWGCIGYDVYVNVSL